jgi:uncharacterized protein (TIGR02270 family)
MTMDSILEQSEESKAFVKDLCFEFAGEAASLWLARQKAVDAPHYNLADLLEMDNRLQAQIDALHVAGVSGWETALAQVKPDQPETFFVACVLALESCDENRIGIMLEKAATTPEASESMISALGWITYEQAQAPIQKLLASGEAIHQSIGIAASAFHRRDPGIYLDNGFYANDTRLKARSLRAAVKSAAESISLLPDICTTSCYRRTGKAVSGRRGRLPCWVMPGPPICMVQMNQPAQRRFISPSTY